MGLVRKSLKLLFALMIFAISASAFVLDFQPSKKYVPNIGSGSHYDAANLTFNPITKLGVNGYQAATGNGISYNNYGTQLSTGQRIGSGVAAGFNVLEAVGVGYGGAKLLTYTGITAPTENFAARTYFNFADRATGSSLYNSFVPGTARLNVTSGGQNLFRAANSEGAASFGNFASLERPMTPFQAIQGSALDPAITPNRATYLFQVTTRPGFSVSGQAAAQSAGYPGGFNQVFQSSRRGAPTWQNVQPIPYLGVQP